MNKSSLFKTSFFSLFAIAIGMTLTIGAYANDDETPVVHCALDTPNQFGWYGVNDTVDITLPPSQDTRVYSDKLYQLKARYNSMFGLIDIWLFDINTKQNVFSVEATYDGIGVTVNQIHKFLTCNRVRKY